MKKLKKHAALIGVAAGFASFLSGLGSMFGVDVAAMVGGAAVSAFCYFQDIERLFDDESE